MRKEKRRGGQRQREGERTRQPESERENAGQSCIRRLRKKTD